MNSESPWATKRPIPFTNVSGETIPAFAAMAITGLVYENGIAFLQCDKPSTTFLREYAVNNMFDVPGGLRGTCFRAGDLRVLYDSGTPANGEGWGPKPGQWSLSRGYPGFAIQGVVNSQHRIAKTFFEPIVQVLVKTTDLVAADATTEDYRVYAGTFGSEADAGFTTVPTVRNRTGQSMDADEWAWLAWTNDGWELRCQQNRVYHCTYSTSPLVAGSAGSVTLPDGRAVTFTNWSTDTTINTNDKILVWQDFTDSGFYGIRSGESNIDRVWRGTALEDIAAGAVGDVALIGVGIVSATNWSNTGVDIFNFENVFVWQHPTDNLYYCIKSGDTSLRWFHATLDSPGLSNGDATGNATTTSALDGGAHPGAVTVNNTWGCAGQTGAVCLIVRDSAGNYELVKVKAIVVEATTEITYDPASERILKYKRQEIVAMREGAESGWQNIFAAEAHNVVEAVAYNPADNKLSYTTYVRYLLPTGGAAPTVNVIHTMVDKTVVDNVTISGTGQLTIDKETVTVWENADASDDVLNLFTTTLLSVVVDVGQTGINIYQDKYLVNVLNPVSGAFRTVAVYGEMCPDESPGTTTLPASESPESNNTAAIVAATHYFF